MPKAAVFFGPNKLLRLKNFPITATPDDMARLAVIASPVYRDDLRIHSSEEQRLTPSILGRQFVGKIQELSPSCKNSGFVPNDIVLADFFVPCGKCVCCKTGDIAACSSPIVTCLKPVTDKPHFHGSFAEIAYAPIGNLVKLPPSIDPLTAVVFAGIAPSVIHACTLAGLTREKVDSSPLAVVQGIDLTGLFSIAYLSSIGVKYIIAVANGETKEYERLAISLGASLVLNLSRHSADEVTYHVKTIGKGVGADAVIECSSYPSAFSLCLRMLRPGGNLVAASRFSEDSASPIDLQPIIEKSLRIFGSRSFTVDDTKAYVDFLLRSERIYPKMRIMTAYYPLADINTAIHEAKCGTSAATVIQNKL